MRSFIKKLAGTMALTMVVSSIAPAGVVFADDEAFIAMQGGDTMVSSITLATGRKVDFRFVGAPANWAELDPTWTSSIPAVADVDAAGVVTAKKAGVTTITIALSNGWTATAKVTVEDIPNDTEAPVYLAFQNTLEAVTNAHVLINTKDGVDFWFINAPEGWEKMNPTWASSNTEVATVDGAGIVRGIADGFTTLTFSLNGEVVASTEITVGNPVVEEPVVEDEFVVEGIDARYELYDEEGNFEGYALLDEETAITVGDALNVSVYYEAYSVDQYGNILVDYSDIYFDEFAWTSSDEEVVTVEDGVLTAVGAGEATLTVAGVVVDGQEEEFTTTVKVAEAEVVVDESYTAKQKTDKQILLTFADATIAEATKKAFDEAKSADKVKFVKLEKVGKSNRNIQIKSVDISEDKTQLTITTYSAFADGDVYHITVNEGEYTELTTTLGYVDALEVSYKSYEEETEMKDSTGIAYANKEDDDAVTVRLSSKLFSNGVDVTNANGYNDIEVVYSFPEDAEYDDDDVELEEEGILTFYKPGVVVQVVATYTYEDADGEEVSVPETLEIVSEAMPAYEIVGVKDWAFAYAPSKQKDKKIDWSNKSVPADEKNAVYIVALIEDSYGNVFITKGGYDNDYTAVEDSKLADAGYAISFVSTDVTKAIVDKDDEVSTWEKTNASIIFKWENADTEKSEEFYAVDFTVKEARKFNKVEVTTEDFEILSDGNFVTQDVTIKLYDQYDVLWTEAEDVTITAKARIDRKDKEYTVAASDIVENGDGTYTFEFDAEDAALAIGKLADKDVDVKYTVTVGKKSDTFNVDLKTAKEDKVKYGLEAGDISQTLNRTKNDYPAIITEDHTIENKITFYEYRSDLKYAKENTSDVTVLASQGALDAMNKLVDKVTNGTEDKTVDGIADAIPEGLVMADGVTEVKKGTRFFTVLGADGKVYTDKNGLFTFEEKENGVYALVVAKAVESEVASDGSLAMQYAPEGKYTAVMYELNKFKKDGSADFKKYEAKFEVTKSNPAVTVDKQVKLASSEGAVEDMILDAISFKLGDGEFKVGTDWNQISADDIIAVDYVDTDNYVVVKKITVRVRVNEYIDNVYYEVPVEVNKTIEKAND